MQKLLVYVLAMIILGSCASVKKYNQTITTPRTPEQLKADVDYTYKKLKKLHPELYWYITKDRLDYKFDSLKTTITEPMTSNEFYFKISPVVASVRQGHLRMIPVTPRMTRREYKAYSKKGGSQLSKFEYEVFDNRLFIMKNNTKDSTIRRGSEVVGLNGIKPQELFARFGPTITSDGFNQTYFPKAYARQFDSYFYVQTGVRDSLVYTLNFDDSIRVVTLKHEMGDTSRTAGKAERKEEVDKKKPKQPARAEAKKRRIQGYNKQTQRYSKNLYYPDPDSTVAVLDINDFSLGHFKKYYREVFRTLDTSKVKALVLDLRGNPGGRLRDICVLYSYLTDSVYRFVDRIESTTRTSYILGHLSGNMPFAFKALNCTVGLPFVLGQLTHVRKENGRFYYSISESRWKQPNPNRYRGKLYVLIDGGSFSASSIISSNLKGSGRAVFVGEETGGAHNGCVAGRMPTYTLPNSKLMIRIGLGVVAPFYKVNTLGRGIMPDVEIKPTIQDRIKGSDPELSWVLNDVKGQADSH